MRLTAAALAVVTTFVTVLGMLIAGPALAQNGPGTPPYWPQSPFSVPSGTGASVPFTEYEAEKASTNGKVIGPDFTQGDLATEASGREAVQLTAQGQYVQFTLTSPANAVDVHYALNQGASGTLSVYVNGSKLSQELSLTSAYSYITTSNIMGSKTHKFYDDVRMMFGQTLAAGTTVRLQADSADTAVPYTIDVADFYNVPAAATQPANSISVTSQGADPTGANDSTTAFRNAISAANAAGESVWIPPGTYLVGSALQVSKATIVGAGDWYSQIKTNELIDNTSAVSGPVNLSGFAILGSTVGRHDDSTANAIDGSLGSGWTVNGLWIQDTNVGFWLQYGNSGCTVENSVIESTDADGLNFNGNASNCTVKNNFLRNTGDDGLAIWSYPTADSNITFSNNTIVQPSLANGIADYGGSNNTISNNVIADTNALGSGLAISNEQFLSPFTPLSGTITVSGNYLIRTGAYNPNWSHPMGAVRFDAYDSAFSNVTVNYSGGAILDSPYEAMEFVSGSGNGNAVTGVNVSNVSVQNVGTVVMQAETQGSGSFSGVTASGVGVPGAYNYSYPQNVAGAFTFNLGSGNSGWSTTPVLTTFPDPVQPGALAASPSSLSFGDVTAGSTSGAQTVTVSNPGSSAASVSSVSTSGPFSQTSTCGSSIAAGGSCTVSVKFAPTSGGNLTGTLSVASSAPGSPLTVALSGKGITPTTNLALGQPVTASSSFQTYVAANAVDGDTSTYWESSDGAGYPQTITVGPGLGAVGRVDHAGPAALERVEHAHRNAVGAREHQRVGVQPDRRLGRIHLQPRHRQHGHHQPAVRDEHPVRAAQLHRQHRLELRPALRIRGLPGRRDQRQWQCSGGVAVEFVVRECGCGVGQRCADGDGVQPGQQRGRRSPRSASAARSARPAPAAVRSQRAARARSASSSPPRPAARPAGPCRWPAAPPGSPLTVALSGTGTSSGTNLALGLPVTASGYSQTYGPANAVDGNTSTYWESTNNAFPQWLQADLGSAVSIGRIVMDLPPSSAWGTRTQTITVQGSTDGTSYTTLAPSAGYTFDPSTGNTASITFPAATVRYVKLTFTANTGWPAGQLSELQIYNS